MSPFSLTYGQDAILPMEVVVPSLRVSKQNGLTPQEYSEAMMMEVELGKWSPNWEGHFKVHQVLHGNAYWLANLQGEPHKRFINGKYLKNYFPTLWEIVKKSKNNYTDSMAFIGLMFGEYSMFWNKVGFLATFSQSSKFSFGEK